MTTPTLMIVVLHCLATPPALPQASSLPPLSPKIEARMPQALDPLRDGGRQCRVQDVQFKPPPTSWFVTRRWLRKARLG